MSIPSKEILFEKFSIEECFKKDQHSAVYLAEHIYLGKRIILKCLNTKTLMDEDVISRFKREAKIMARLDHPNIIKVLDFGMYNEYFYISSEFFEGNNLRYFIKENNFSSNEIKKLSIQLFSGLSYAHKHKIIHRDIKPENIFLNNNLDLKIGDFGLALSMSDNFVTGQQSVLGTPCYMSPEQISGESLTESSDLFSAGIVLVELISGLNPFLGKDISESINNIVNLRELNLEKLVSQENSEIREVVEKLLNKRLSERYDSADEVLKVLGETTFSDAPKPVNKRWFIVPILLIATVAVFFFLRFWSDEKDITESPVLPADTPLTSDIGNERAETRLDKNTEPKVSDKSSSVNEQPEKKVEPEIKNGSLFVDCKPWADLYIDGKKIDTTPLEESIELESGEYNLKLVHPNFPEWSEQIFVPENNMLSIQVNMDTLVGFLDCKIRPWGEVILDGKSYGVTPLDKPIRLAPGSYNLTLKNSGFSSFNKKITVSRRDTLLVKHIFRKLE